MADGGASLNHQQQAAVRLLDRPLLVLAGAGSGKTRVITEKIAYLIERGLPARHIAALTFTNKAAREMKARAAALLDDKKIRGLRVSTFHSLGLDVLRREHATLGFKPALSLFDEQDRNTVLRELLKQNTGAGDSDSVEDHSRRISRWKNAFVTAQQASRQHDPEQGDSARLYEHYTRQLKAYNAVDFDDLILLPVLLFQRQPEILERWRNRIRYLLVDEYQDTNLTQYQLIRLLAGSIGHLTVVGDDDQSIYAWRGAHPDNLVQLQKDYPRLQVIKLEQNYRSSGRILKAANNLIANNPHLFEKRLWSDHGPGERLRVLSHSDEVAEARQIASEIVHHRFRTGSRYRDYVILYRSNHQSRLFERTLREYDIPYKLSGGTSFFSYAEVKDILAYLRLLANPDDDCAFLRVINTPRREIGASTLEQLGRYAGERHISLFAACFELGLTQRLSERALNRLRRFCDRMVDTADRAGRGDLFGVIREMIDRLGYEQWLNENSKTEPAARRKMANVNELIDWMERLAKQEATPPSLDDLVGRLLLFDILERSQEEDASDRVNLMTLHAAKGLEFPHVFLVGMEENLLPHQTSIDENSIEEERRLAYVGITRAQKSVTLSYCRRRKRHGELRPCTPSRFLDELPDEDLEWSDKQPADREHSKARGRASLAQLRELLSEK